MTEIDNAVSQAVQSCLEHERSVAIHYQAPGYTSSAIRVIDPYHIVGFRGGQWDDIADGGIILRFLTNQREQTLFWVSQWGPNAEILDPDDLREQAAEWMESAAVRYRD